VKVAPPPIVGRAVKAGSAVKKFKEGDIAAVGCLVDSCRQCTSCLAGQEQYCENFMPLTYKVGIKPCLASIWTPKRHI
jgi:D-arabinose 1-dehydrogenase-like Zn-dependent alcohol dehydrogenase